MNRTTALEKMIERTKNYIARLQERLDKLTTEYTFRKEQEEKKATPVA